MKKIPLILIIALIAFAGCGKENFNDKYLPEIMYYQNANVENANFSEIILARGVAEFTVKARVSAPYKLKEIRIYKNLTGIASPDLVGTYLDFQLDPSQFMISSTILNITGNTEVKIVATDMNGKESTKLFTIKVTL